MLIEKSLVLLMLVGGLALAPDGLGAAESVPLTVSATVGAEGTNVLVAAPGCQVTPPGEFEIFVQSVSTSGEVGEGAVGAGTFTAPGRGSVLIPAGTPSASFLLSVSCNRGTRIGSLPFVLTTPLPGAPVVAPARFTG